MNQTVAVFGATGAQGAPVAAQAIEAGFTVRAIARDTDRIAALHPAAQPFAASLDDEDALVRAMEGVDAAFVHLPAPSSPEDPVRWMHNLFAAAHRVSLPLMVYTTSASCGPRYPSSPMIDGANAGMQAVLNSGIPAIVLQPTIYLENLQIPPFLPRLPGDGILDYPPLPAATKVTWTSHHDQARVAVAALSRPDLAGQSFEIGSPGAMTGAELADLLAPCAGRAVRFEPLSPAEFGQRVEQVLGVPGMGYVLTDLYTALSGMPPEGMVIDTDAVERVFGITLTPAADHLAAWKPMAVPA